MMRLVIDANILVAELLRKRGRDLIRLPELEFYLAEQVKDEAQYELRKRVKKIVSQGKLTELTGEEQLKAALQLIETKIRLVPKAFYSYLEAEARKRIPRDPNDWETVALALALPAEIWTEDSDFLGCGCPTWTTQTLLLQLIN
ncbi:MAG: PIN domain-containing protein [Oscillatoria sp. PMC 1068.18]|nr:PIN domain-containing protein [Oscillatoria sp. PMC 1076.18]MEC4989709.1 PIN domain-containing protein [Oscillatoria sp. PMC 1068.18]